MKDLNGSHRKDREAEKHNARADKHEAVLARHVAALMEDYPAYFPDPSATFEASLGESAKIIEDQRRALRDQETRLSDLHRDISSIRRRSLWDQILWADTPESLPWRLDREARYRHLSAVQEGWRLKRFLEHVGFPPGVWGGASTADMKQKFIRICENRLFKPGFVDFPFPLGISLEEGHARAILFRIDLSKGIVSHIALDYRPERRIARRRFQSRGK
jgi:hypothetical protein